MKSSSLALIMALSYSGFAYAETGVYTSLKVGISDTKMSDNRVNYFYDDDHYYSHEDYYQHDQSQSIYPNISAAIGFDFSQVSRVNTRIEFEYTYKDGSPFTPPTNYEVWENTYDTNTYPREKDNTFFSHDLSSQSLMANAYYDLKNQSKFTPYIGVGVGVTRIKNHYINLPYPEYNLSQNDHHFTWSAGVGVAYHIANNVSLDLSYKYLDAGQFKFGQDFKEYENEMTSFTLSSQDYSLGIRYNF